MNNAPPGRRVTDLFIHRPVLALVVSFVIIIAGLQAISSLNIRQYPRSENATITVPRSMSGQAPTWYAGLLPPLWNAPLPPPTA